MRQFPLKVGAVMRNLDTDGRVLDSTANVVGSWSLNADNKILITRAGGSDTVDVDWLFNADNQLVVTQDGQSIFTVMETTDGLPRFQLRKNRLIVDPDGDGDFAFTLACLFGLNNDGNLVVSIGGKESVIDGFIEDSKARFRFQFSEKGGGSFPNSLVLSGKWERKAAITNEIRLHFMLDDPTLEITSKPLDLPGVVRINPARNHLELTYQSQTHGERRLQFLGSLEIKPGFTLAFRIDDSNDGAVRKSSITVESTFEFDAAKGNLQLFVGKTKTAASQVVEVSGDLQATLKNNATLDWKFAYIKNTAGGKAATTIATSVSFESKNTKLFLTYQKDGTTQRIDISAKVKASDYAIGVGATIVNDNQGRSLKGFIGVSW